MMQGGNVVGIEEKLYNSIYLMWFDYHQHIPLNREQNKLIFFRRLDNCFKLKK